jgi:predicted Zn-dependent peptidase
LLYKRKGIDRSIVKVEKPPITPVETNAGKQSPFVKQVEAMPVAPVTPQWLDYNTGITHAKAGIASVLYVPNKENDLFHLYYRLDMGSWNSRLLPMAAEYLQYLGTAAHPTAEISRAFYSIACNFSVNASTETTTISITGLQENFGRAVAMFEEVMRQCLPDSIALVALKDRLLKSRANNKLNKQAIMQGLINYARYGPKNPFNSGLTTEELRALKPEDLTNVLHSLLDHPHTIIYYGPLSPDTFTRVIATVHPLPASWTPYPDKVRFPFVEQSSNKVLFADYDMVQAEICWIRNSGQYDVRKEAVVDLFDNYFGGNMGSVVFQTLRESKALAYSTYASYETPAKKEDPFFILAYIGCQADKLNEAIDGMNALLGDLPVSAKGFELARAGEKKDIETERFTGDEIVFEYLGDQEKGLDYDQRKEEYAELGGLTMDDVKRFHEQEIAGKAYTYCVVASQKRIRMEDLKKRGDVKVLTLEEVFGY